MIIGLTDKPILRRDGKIRAGRKEEGKHGKLVNTEGFLLHDAPGLVELMGPEVKEIYFTVHSDVIEDFLKADLRQYAANNIVCMSMHGARDKDGQPLRQPNNMVAAYFGLGEGVAGVRQQQFPRIQKARVRNCDYKECPNYMAGDCGEHLFLDVIVPQYSMGALFTLDNTSINAVMNTMSTFQKARSRYGGKLSGQIFKLCKRPGEIKWTGTDGKSGKREVPIIFVDQVNFDEYEKQFRSQISNDDWTALMRIRNNEAQLLAAPPLVEALPGTTMAQIGAPEVDVEAERLANEAAIRARAEDPAAEKVFAEIAALAGKENSADARFKTAKNFADVASMIDYLKKKIAEAKKAKAGPAKEVPPQRPALTNPAIENPLY